VTASRLVVIGADTHLDTVHLAALDGTGKPLGDAQFLTRPVGYYVAIKWAQSFGAVQIAGVEGTSSYGAGLTRALQDAGIEVAKVTCPDRAARRRQGKSDPLDAYAPARTALAGYGLAVPKDEHTHGRVALSTAATAEGVGWRRGPVAANEDRTRGQASGGVVGVGWGDEWPRGRVAVGCGARFGDQVKHQFLEAGAQRLREVPSGPAPTSATSGPAPNSSNSAGSRSPSRGSGCPAGPMRA
jgi:hypothetical protein